jgi:hypothetical protein
MSGSASSCRVATVFWFVRAFGMASVLAWCPIAVAAPDSFELGDGVAGPTCANFVSMGELAWSRTGGDWVDAKGKLYGDQPFASQSIPLSKGQMVVDWNVTALVQDFFDGRYRNVGMLLRPKPGAKNGIVSFLSRESPDSAGWPMLKLKWADGSHTRLAPSADTYLDCTSLSSLGAKANMKVSGSQSAVLRFALPTPKTRLVEAVLYLVSDQQYVGASDIGVYRVAPPYARQADAVKQGIADSFVRDEGIDTHPDVLFATGFESYAWIAQWSYYDPRNTAETISSDDARLFEPLLGKALRVRLVKGKNLGLDLRYSLSRYGATEPEEIYFRYYLRFGNDWNPSSDGGKMPGIAGTYGRAGWGMRKSDGYNGWSVRGGFASRPSSDKSVAGMTAIGSYAYHVDVDASGDYWGWNEGPSGLMQNNRWYSVEQYVKLNTPGAHDGIFRAWIDGRPVLEKTAIQFRLTPKLKIENVWMDVYYGGVAPPPQDMTLYIDNVVIARKYIGPMKR